MWEMNFWKSACSQMLSTNGKHSMWRAMSEGFCHPTLCRRMTNTWTSYRVSGGTVRRDLHGSVGVRRSFFCWIIKSRFNCPLLFFFFFPFKSGTTPPRSGWRMTETVTQPVDKQKAIFLSCRWTLGQRPPRPRWTHSGASPSFSTPSCHRSVR